MRKNIRGLSSLPVLLLLVLLGGCKSAPNPERAAAESAVALERVQRLHWFVGDWRMAREDGFTGESWVSVSPGLLMGMGYTLKQGGLVAHESMRVEIRDGDLFYIAQPGSSATAVEFRMTEISDGHILFRNPEHDFPSWIRYERKGPDRCLATVGGDGGQIEFDYMRIPYGIVIQD